MLCEQEEFYMRKPLEHIKVLDFTRVLAGPFCTMILANMGAEIIKIERLGSGDDSRSYGPFINGQSAYFISINRGKKSISIDLKSEKGIEVVRTGKQSRCSGRKLQAGYNGKAGFEL